MNLALPIWFDEAYSAFLIRGNFSDIWKMTAMDVHPPFYYFCLKLWSLIFGTSDIALRSMSVFFGIIALILIFFLIKRLFGKKPALLSTLFLTISPFFLRYTEEMRMYTLTLVIVLSATLVLDYVLKTKEQKKTGKFWIIYAVLVSLGMWTHYFSAFAWLTHLVFIIFYFKKEKQLKVKLKTLFSTYVLAIVLYTPWIPSFFSQVKTVQNGFWIPPVNLTTPFDFFSETLLLKSASETESWLSILILSTIALSAFLSIKHLKQTKSQEEKNNLFYLIMLIFLPPLFLIILSLPPLKPTFMPRYVFYSSALLSSLLGIIIYHGRNISIAKIQKKFFSIMLAVLLFISSAIGICAVINRENPADEKDIISLINEKADKNSPILLNVSSMDYYNLFFYEKKENPIYGSEVNIEWGSLEPIKAYGKNLEDPLDFLKNEDSFWLVIPTDSKYDEQFSSDFKLKEKIETEKFVALAFYR